MDAQFIEPDSQEWLEILANSRHDFYHLPDYIRIESWRTKTIPKGLRILEGEKLFFIPLLIRSCEELLDSSWSYDDVFDVVSPYGYPGIILNEEAEKSPEFLVKAIDKLISTLCESKICSAFLRLHPVINQNFDEIPLPSHSQITTSETIVLDLGLSPEEIWSQTRSDHRKDINRHKRNGLTARMVNFREYRDEFVSIYRETMDRLNASSIYYFSPEYFHELSYSLDDKFHLGIVESEGEIMSACLFSECCGIIQSYLSGTRNKFLKRSPDKLLFDYVRYWAKERGNSTLHLGGGYGGNKDGVYNFKAGFSKQRSKFFTLRLITDVNRYANLLEMRSKSLNLPIEKLLESNFFPTYRAMG